MLTPQFVRTIDALFFGMVMFMTTRPKNPKPFPEKTEELLDYFREWRYNNGPIQVNRVSQQVDVGAFAWMYPFEIDDELMMLINTINNFNDERPLSTEEIAQLGHLLYGTTVWPKYVQHLKDRNFLYECAKELINEAEGQMRIDTTITATRIAALAPSPLDVWMKYLWMSCR